MVRKVLRIFGLWFPGMGATDNAVLFAGIVLILLFAMFAYAYGVLYCVEALRRGELRPAAVCAAVLVLPWTSLLWIKCR